MVKRVVKIKIFGPFSLCFSKEIDPGTPLDRPGAPRTSFCTKNQPRRPILMPFRSEMRKREKNWTSTPPKRTPGGLPGTEKGLPQGVFGVFKGAPKKILRNPFKGIFCPFCPFFVLFLAFFCPFLSRGPFKGLKNQKKSF